MNERSIVKMKVSTFNFVFPSNMYPSWSSLIVNCEYMNELYV